MHTKSEVKALKFVEVIKHGHCLDSKVSLPIKQFTPWMDALKKDDLNFIKSVLHSCTKDQKNLLLNGQFLYSHESDHWLRICENACPSVHRGTQWRRPLFILLAAGSFNVLEFFLLSASCKDVNILSTDDDDSNILHAIVLASKCRKDVQTYMSVYSAIMKSLDKETKKKLFLAENKEGLRPVELSVKEGQMGLFRMMFDEPGVYRFEKDHIGMRREVWYDVTVYESYECSIKTQSRQHKSPLEFLSFLQTEDLDQETCKECFDWPVLQTWLHIKLLMNLPFLIGWFLWRVATCITLYTLNPVLFPTDSYNGSTSNVTFSNNCEMRYKASFASSLIMVIYCMFIICLDMYEFIRNLWYWRCHTDLHELFLRKDFANHNFFYR